MSKQITQFLIALAILASAGAAKGQKTITKKVEGGTISISPAGTQPPKPPVPPEKKWSFIPDVVATVGDKTITKAEFIKAAEAHPLHQTAGNTKEYAKSIANQLVDRLILLQLAEKAGFKPSAELAREQFSKMVKSLTPDKKKMFEQWLKAQKQTTIEEFEKTTCDDPERQEAAAINSWLENKVFANIKVSPEQAKAFYDKEKDKFKMPETVQASHILIKPDGQGDEAKKKAKAKAEEILAKLKKGADFAETAKKESGCPSSAKGGDLGEFERGRMVPEFEKAAFALKPGELSDVVETKFGYHIIKTTKHNPGETMPFEKVEPFIKNHLRQDAERTTLKTRVDEAKKTMKVKINI